ncbi:MAG TPA: AAA family ATPase [Thermoanaerobaculia bacterium]|nr:AAA family ATPase [Thermoanaerobaculia bacterium]
MAIEQLASLIAMGFPGENRKELEEPTREAITGLFGDRYAKASKKQERVAFMPDPTGIPFAGVLHDQSPSSGAYGGMSLVWFPIEKSELGEAGSLLTFVVGTRGLSPDEQILGRPGHARYLRALARYLRQEHGLDAWAKSDPANLLEDMPRIVTERFPAFENVFKKYGQYIYAAVEVPRDPDKARPVVQAFLDLYAFERQWKTLKAAESEVQDLLNDLRAFIFPRVSEADVHDLLRERRFVILQGPPGTGKTRMADRLRENQFQGHGRTVQFHSAVTYETFVAGIAPSVESQELKFDIRSGWLVDAIQSADGSDSLLVIDEINRADLGRVLGEAIYLLEPREIGAGQGRVVKLPQPLKDGDDSLSIPKSLFILGTMNTADRSIALMDLAVRRRFAFVDLWPDIEVIREQDLPLATEAFSKLQDVFVLYAPDDSLSLLPGHAYFLANSEGELRRRLRYEVIPLLRDYLREGRLGPAESELRAYIDWLEGAVQDGAAG